LSIFSNTASACFSEHIVVNDNPSGQLLFASAHVFFEETKTKESVVVVVVDDVLNKRQAFGRPSFVQSKPLHKSVFTHSAPHSSFVLGCFFDLQH
tara:strand:- start:77 stop:361 length:285 start_codon:yes stop_codon:yes gene_type:complete